MEPVSLIHECIAHLSSPGAYFSSRQRLAVSLEAAATFDACGDCARLWDACLKPGSSVLALLRKSAMEPSVAGLPREVALCVRAITNLQSKLTIEFYNDLVRAATVYSTLTLTEDETKAAAAELIAVVSVATSLTTLVETLGLQEHLALPALSDVADAPPVGARRLSAMGSAVVPGATFGPLIGRLGTPPPGESLPSLLGEMPFRGLGLVPFEARFFARWLGGLYMDGWKVIFASWRLGARRCLDRGQMEVVAEHYTGTVACAY